MGFSFYMILSTKSFANFTSGISSNSWQEKLPITYTDPLTSTQVKKDYLGTFSTVSVNIGYENLFSKRWRYAIQAAYHLGEVDFHKLESF